MFKSENVLDYIKGPYIGLKKLEHFMECGYNSYYRLYITIKPAQGLTHKKLK